MKWYYLFWSTVIIVRRGSVSTIFVSGTIIIYWRLLSNRLFVLVCCRVSHFFELFELYAPRKTINLILKKHSGYPTGIESQTSWLGVPTLYRWATDSLRSYITAVLHTVRMSCVKAYFSFPWELHSSISLPSRKFIIFHILITQKYFVIADFSSIQVGCHTRVLTKKQLSVFQFPSLNDKNNGKKIQWPLYQNKFPFKQLWTRLMNNGF